MELLWSMRLQDPEGDSTGTLEVFAEGPPGSSPHGGLYRVRATIPHPQRSVGLVAEQTTTRERLRQLLGHVDDHRLGRGRWRPGIKG